MRGFVRKKFTLCRALCSIFELQRLGFYSWKMWGGFHHAARCPCLAQSGNARAVWQMAGRSRPDAASSPKLPTRNNKLFEILACGDGQKSGTTWSHVLELSASYKIVLLGPFVRTLSCQMWRKKKTNLMFHLHCFHSFLTVSKGISVGYVFFWQSEE